MLLIIFKGIVLFWMNWFWGFFFFFFFFSFLSFFSFFFFLLLSFPFLFFPSLSSPFPSFLLTPPLNSYEDPDIAVTCGAILRDCIRQDTLCKIVLNSDLFFNFFKYVEMANFDTASDAFTTFKDLLTVQKAVAADFLEKNYDAVCKKRKGERKREKENEKGRENERKVGN